MRSIRIVAVLAFFGAFSSAEEVKNGQAAASQPSLQAKEAGDPCSCAEGLCTCGLGLDCADMGGKRFVCVPKGKKAGDACGAVSNYDPTGCGLASQLVCRGGICGGDGEINDVCKDPYGAGPVHACGPGLSCSDTGSKWDVRHCVGGGREGDYCSSSDAGTGSKSCSGNLLCRPDKNGETRCQTPVVGGQGDVCDAGVHICGPGLSCRVSNSNQGEFHCVGRGLFGDLCGADDANAGSKSCSGDLVCRNVAAKGEEYRCVGNGGRGDICGSSDAGTGSSTCSGSLICRVQGDKYKCIPRYQQDEQCGDSAPCDSGLNCRDTGSGLRCVGRGQQNDLCPWDEIKTGSKSCSGALVCRDAGGEARCVGSGRPGDFCNRDDAGTGSKSCLGDALCRLDDKDNKYRCIKALEQNEECDLNSRAHNSNCASGLKCTNVLDSSSRQDWHCVGRGQTGDYCAASDTAVGSKSCSGNLLCRFGSDSFARCIAPQSLQQGEKCDSGEAGHGSASCAGSLKCRDVSTGGSDYRCVGRGLVGDLCAEADANAGSASCSQDFLCRAQGGQYKCVARSAQNQPCGGLNSCKTGLSCSGVGSGNYCVGRGWRNDLCAKSDAGHGSASCGGSLKCRDTGNSQWNCVGGGGEGDLCPHEKGSPECVGSLVCREQSDGKSRCVRK